MIDFVAHAPAKPCWRAWPARLGAWLDAARPAGDLLLRLWLAQVFWVSGQTKIQSWDSTLYLFENEYAVPLLPPEWAAYLATSVELAFPVLLVLGLGGRFAAWVLLVFNGVAVLSYPDLGAAGLEQHGVWGLMLLVALLHGPGAWSLDHWLGRRWRMPR
ncbi:putative oxidoreductase [Methylomagnum ishizawai]|uniref:Putative oxidoreductase n=1 Tax=Methylomagnum ishizawai TaxID=1760988 RepID=A0A1Y6D5D0_9GAMM|nr:DoxX family protein [Methylomagnum ishizawai]SMF97630.1 putative oxidoreductase [Methylomagnum ishizawai]